MNATDFISFRCTHCQSEIEARAALIGQRCECPACGETLVVPAPEDDVPRHGPDDASFATSAAMNSRTIRIELDGL